MIRVEGVTKTFGERTAVEDVSFLAEDGVITGLLGPNGSGKTTTLRTISGIVAPDRGRVHREGSLGVLSESRALYPRLTAEEHLRYFGALRGVAPAAFPESLGLGELASRRALGFSQGEATRVALGCALVHDPENLILDEPTNGLDVVSVRAVRDLLRRLRDAGKCILFSSHVMQEVSALCDRLVVLAGGRVVAAGNPRELLERSGFGSLEDLLVTLADDRQEAS